MREFIERRKKTRSTEREPNVTWKDVAKTLDIMASMLIFLALYINFAAFFYNVTESEDSN